MSLCAHSLRYLVLAIALALFLAAPSQAAVYQWVDDSNTVQFSQNPPMDRPYKVVTPNSTPPGNVEEAWNRLDVLLEKQKQSQEARETRQREQQEKAAQQKTRRLQCEQARERLANLQSRPRLRITEKDGTVRRVTGEERQQKIKQTSSLIEDVCRD